MQGHVWLAVVISELPSSLAALCCPLEAASPCWFGILSTSCSLLELGGMGEQLHPRMQSSKWVSIKVTPRSSWDTQCPWKCWTQSCARSEPCAMGAAHQGQQVLQSETRQAQLAASCAALPWKFCVLLYVLWLLCLRFDCCW